MQTSKECKMGIWEVKVYHYKSHRSRNGHAIAFMMNDEDAKKGCLPKAFERAIDAVKKSIDIDKEKKYANK